ncbi:ABC transporter substrate-binding protein [Egicoccus halophilus]|uniref:ABC transporter substrate-binding protein n=1 Tax=Egicoccus halophilus TaxID=1670830 RepID=A0A8J3AAL1_9ACTN|nr:ABC transporter substrate-binding protein [Egicoccus halophilus]
MVAVLRERALVTTVLVILSGLIVAPVAAIFYGAVRTGAPGMADQGFTLTAVREVYTTGPYLATLGWTLLMAVGVAAISTTFGACAAWLLTRTDLRWKNLFELSVIAPLFLSPFVGALAWVALAAPNSGMVNVNLRWLLDTDATFVNIMTFTGVVFVLNLYYIPYGYLFVSSALKNMDPSLEEASYLNGRGVIATVRHVTFPIIRPALLAAFFFIAVLATGIFSVPGVLGLNATFNVLAVEVYRSMSIWPTNHARGAAIGTLLLWFTVLGVYFYRRAIRHASRYVTISARGTRPRVVRLGWVRYLISAVFLGYLLFATLLPYVALGIASLNPFTITDFRQMQFSFNNFLEVASSGRIVDATINTLVLGVVTPTATVLLGLAAAYCVVRMSGRTGAVVDYLATVPIAIPGIVFATGMLWVYVRTPLYATLTLLVIAFMGTYIPHAARFAGNSLMQIDPALEESSRVTGASRMRTLRRITLPLSKPSLLSAWVLVFVFVVREINTAILLYAPDTQILSVVAWGYIQDGTVRNAAVVGLLQTLVLIGGVLIARFLFRVKLSSTQV